MARRPSNPPTDHGEELLGQDDAAGRITHFFEQLGADSTVAVSVYEVDPKNRLRRSFLFELPDVAGLTGAELMAQVLEKYGPGEYLAEGRDAEGRIKFNPRFVVGSVKQARAQVPDPRAAAAASAPPELVAMLERNTRALEALAARPQPSMIEMVRELAAVRELFAPPPPPPAAPAMDLGNLIGLVKQVLDLRDTLGNVDGAAATDGPLGILARSLAPALTKIAERAVEQPPAALPNPAAPTGDETTQPTAATAEEGDMAANGMMMKAYVAQLVRFAEQGIEPQAAADRVLQTLAPFPEPIVAALYDWLNDEAVIEQLAALDPRATQYSAWLEQVVDKVLDALSEPEETPPPPAMPVNSKQPVSAP